MKRLVLLFIIINFSNCAITDAIDDLFSEECEGIKLVQDEGDKAYTNSDLEKAVDENIECEELKFIEISMGDHEKGYFSKISSLESISKMKNLNKITEYLSIGNTSIKSLKGLEIIKYSELIFIYNNTYLENLDGLKGLETVGGVANDISSGLGIECNHAKDLNGLGNLIKVKGHVSIKECYLEVESDLPNLVNVGGDKNIKGPSDYINTSLCLERNCE